MYGEKTERNTLIRLLWKSGEKTQYQLATIYGLTQSRISSIIYRRVPSRRYCNYCKKDTLNRTKGVCPACRKINLEKRKYKDVEKQKAFAFRREMLKQRYIITAKNREQRIEKARFDSKYGEKTCKKCSAKYVGYRLKMCRNCIKKRYALKRTCITCGIFSRGYSQCIRCAPLLRQIPREAEGRDRIRVLVRIRDKHTCQDCGLKRLPAYVKRHNTKIVGLKGKIKSLDVHHLNGICGKKSLGYDSYKEIGGLITLCHKCHYARHDFQPTIQKNLAK